MAANLRGSSSLGPVTASTPLEGIIKEFQNVLTADELRELHKIKNVPDADAVLVFTAQLDYRNRQRTGPSISSRLYNVLQSVRDFCGVIDVFVSSHPEIAALVWGSVKLTMLVMHTPKKPTYASNKRTDYYKLHFIQLFTLFTNEFKPDADAIQERSQNVREHLALAKVEADLQAQRLQDLERREASHSRHTMATFFSRANRDLDETVAWQLRRDEQQARERRQQVLDALSTHDYLTPLKQARRTWGSNTAKWVFGTPEFDRWINGTSALLWCSGKIGSGKTILATSVIDHLLTKRRRPGSCILRQRLSPDFSGEIETRLKMLDFSFQLPEIIDLLHTAFVSETHYIVIDGFDECEKESRQTLLKGLSLLASLEPSLKLFLSGRESLSGEVRNSFPSLEHVSMDCAAMNQDIKAYIEDIIKEKIDCEDLIVGDSNLPDEIKHALINGANGMFLWVIFQVQEICSQHCDEDIRKAIKNLPRDITETFNRATHRIISKGQRRPAEKIFQWVAGAKRPLNLNELREALAIEVGQQFSKPERYYNDLHKIASWCENLIRVDEELQLVQFAHHTVRQFLLEKPPGSDFHIALEEVNHEIGEICVTYLNFNDFDTIMTSRHQPLPPFEPMDIALTALSRGGNTSKITQILHKASRKSNSKSVSVDDIRRVLNYNNSQDPETVRNQLESQHAFLRYASKHWISHTQGFQDGKSRTWPIWGNMIIYGHDLAMKPWQIDGHDAHDSTALQWAYESRHYPLLKLLFIHDGSLTTTLPDLIKKCIECDDHEFLSFILGYYDKDLDLKSALQIAVRSGHLKVVQTLLLAGAHLYVNDAATSDELTVLQAAALGGHLDIVETLLRAEADVNATNAFYRSTAIQAAIVGGHLAIVERLLRAGAIINDSGIRYHSQTLSKAAYIGGRSKAVERLLITGAHVNARSKSQTTTLNQFLQGGSCFGYIQTGVWNTLETCPWDQPQMRHSKRINFATPFYSPPRVITWLQSLEMGRGRNWRIRVYPIDIDRRGFTIHADSSANSILYSAGVSWLAYHANNLAVISGSFSAEGKQTVHGNYETLRPKTTGFFHFPKALARTPKIVMAIDSLDYNHIQDLDLTLTTRSITRTGFAWHFECPDAAIFMASASFFAF
ncbi:hypothetical protein O1611_g5788 [Lasiodiplodia mahajangana]|uniref:Uncharacterized protein n=1 Tax=Lasiodiplodia mahajangana TaxID=1108764 RepID=A0ACC2JKF5_9PEZI|nr:hypothetical protein O1611_g5788 [Lasiodiplodia mahajangana]